MFIKNITLIICALFISQIGFGGAMPAPAHRLSPTTGNQCLKDIQGMVAQVGHYGSISNAGCPMAPGNWGITRVVYTPGSNCSGTCYYAGGNPPKSCTWQAGNWGDTLSCQ